MKRAINFVSVAPVIRGVATLRCKASELSWSGRRCGGGSDTVASGATLATAGTVAALTKR